MLITGEPFEFEPFGRRFLKFSQSTDQTGIEKEIDETPPTVFRIRQHDGEESYEEIFACGKTLVWSHNGARLLKTFTTDFVIIDAFWHSFSVSTRDEIGQSNEEGSWDSLCIVGEKNLDVYRIDDGELFQQTLPFSVRRVYSTSFGLLLERTPTAVELRNPKPCNDQLFPFLFSLSNPLNEIVPVICKSSDGGRDVVRYTTNLDMGVVYSDVQRSILLTFDRKSGVHTLWTIKKASKQDAKAASELLQQSMLSNSSIFSQTSLNTSKLTPSGTHIGPPPFFNNSPSFGLSLAAQSSSQKTSSMQQTTVTGSLSSGMLQHLFAPMSSTPEQQGLVPPLPSLIIDNRSPAASTRSRIFGMPSALALTPRPGGKGGNLSANPAISRIMRLNNSGEMTNSSLGSIILTPRSAYGTSPKAGDLYQSYFPSPALNSYHAGDYMNLSTHGHSAVPFVPDLCMEALWSEPPSDRARGDTAANCGASKAVVVEDIAGGSYLCYMISSLGQLRCLKIVRKRDSTRVNVSGSVSVIPCRDLAVVADSKLMLVLDPNNVLNLYNGIKKVSPLYCDTMSLLSPPDKYGSEFNKSHASRIFSSSEIAPNSDAMDCGSIRDAVDEIISPVRGGDQSVGASQTGQLSSNFSAVETFCEQSPYFLVTLNSRRISRCSIPTTKSSPAVKLCLDAFKSILPADVVVELYSSWFVKAQSPSTGAKASPFANELAFLKFVMDSTGFPQLGMFRKLGIGDESITEIPAKRSRCSEDGSDADWAYLIDSLRKNGNTERFGSLIPASEDPQTVDDRTDEADGELIVRSTAPFFSNLPTIFFTLHSCFEEMKLNQLQWPLLEYFGRCLYTMARALGCSSYVDHYLRDFSDALSDEPRIAIPEGDANQMRSSPYLSSDCLDVFRLTYRLIGEMTVEKKKVPIISCCERTWAFYVLYRLVRGDIRRPADIHSLVTIIGDQSDFQRDVLRILDTEVDTEDVSDLMAKLLHLAEFKCGKGTAVGLLATSPPGIVAPLLLRLTPPLFRSIRPDWQFDGKYETDLVDPSTIEQPPKPCRERATAKLKSHDTDGMSKSFMNDELSKLLFPNDVRLRDVRGMLRSSKQAKISLQQKAGVSDSDFREEQERHLYSICVRTMALSIGRGMFTLRSHRPLLAESIEIPKLCLTGRTAGQQSLTIDLSHIELPTNMELWPKFHNGVAAGLRIASVECSSSMSDQQLAQRLDTSWIVYNMPRTSSSAGNNNDGGNGGGASAPLTSEHAGFLFGLGLNGHLNNLALFNLHEYLVKGDSMTSIALLLGTAAAKCGTADLQAMKMLSTHLPFLLLPTLLELNIDSSVQTASVMGIGLLYAESGNYRLAEALVKEIGRPSTALNDHFADRESYALSCGFALGMITLGLGDMVFGDPNFTLANELCLLMNGGHKKAHHYATDAPASQLVKDGDFLNVHVTSAPAIVALGLMYLKSGNSQVASWFDPPETLALLDTVRPDLLMLRIVSKSIIMWNDLVPSVDWVESHVPKIVARYVTMDEEDRVLAIREQFVDLESVAQSYCNVVAGACLGIALKFAGSANADAFSCLIHYYKLFDSTYQEQNSATWRKMHSRAGRYTTECVLNVIIMAMGAVMAGTGNLDVLRIVRHLRQRIGPTSSNWLLYGAQMATHIALGLLYLGGGRYTLSTSNMSVAALLCALYPRFPNAMSDNRFHLQAFRHLYVLACEPRLLITKDHLTSNLAYCDISLTFKGCRHYDAATETRRTPCILPELGLLEEIKIDDERYWPIRFTAKNLEELRRIMKSSDGLEIFRRAGFCTRKDDPEGYRSTASKLLFDEDDWLPPDQDLGDQSLEIMESLRLWCAKRDRDFVYPTLVDLMKLANDTQPRTFNIWQLKLLLAYMSDSSIAYHSDEDEEEETEDGVEFLLALEMKHSQKLRDSVDAMALQSYLDNLECDVEDCYKGNHPLMMGEFLTFFDLPPRQFWSKNRLREYRSGRAFIEKFKSLDLPIVTALAVNQVLEKLRPSGEDDLHE